MRIQIALLLTTVMLLSYNDLSTFLPYTIEGIVVDGTTGNPLENVYVYTVKGEEEALTNKKGTFSFTTWRTLPLTLVLQHQEKGEKKVVLLTLKGKLKITL